MSIEEKKQWIRRELPFGSDKKERSYQTEILRILECHFKEHKRALVHLATGAGKTFIAMEYLRRKIEAGEITPKKPVIWMVHRSCLLLQALRELYSVPQQRREQLGLDHQAIAILGDNPNLSISEGSLQEGENNQALIYFTTRQSFDVRYEQFSKTPSYIVWDECHEGDGRGWQQGPKILNHFRKKKTKILGLTATPKQNSWSFEDTDVVYSKTLKELIALGHLAKPKMISVSTGISWNPDVDTIRNSDFRNTSELNTPRRNRLIVKEYVNRQAEYGKTIVFAINIDHAEKLIREFQKENITATYVHSQLPKKEIVSAIKDYQSGRKEVIINVSMLKEGFDAPNTKTIFMCRPTNSETFYLQSIGRGTRIPEGSTKKYFNIVDFVDNLSRYRDSLATANRFFSGANNQTERRRYSPSREMNRRVNRGEHFFESNATPSFICEQDGLPAGMNDFWYYPGQTFGVEIEITGKNYQNQDVFEKWGTRLIKTLNKAAGRHRVLQSLADYGSGITKLWNVEQDRSCGWEVVSPILQGMEGIQELVKVLLELEDLLRHTPLRLNWQTGFHLHLGWICNDVNALKSLIVNMHEAEPYLASIVSRSRYQKYIGYGRYQDKPNQYCKPIRGMVTKTLLQEARTTRQLLNGFKERYATLNLKPLSDKNTIEFRFHNGTTDAVKAVRWLSLCQQIFYRSLQQTNWQEKVNSYNTRRIIRPDRSQAFHDWVCHLPGGHKNRFVDSVLKRSRDIISS